MNLVILVGRLGKDPETRETDSTTVAKFSIATDEYSQSKGKYTEWHNCVAFGKTAETVSRFLAKGSLVSIQGKLSTDKYEKDGETRFFTSVIVNRVNFLSGGKGQQQRDDMGLGGVPADDLPF